MSLNINDLTTNIEKSVKLRPSQRAILKVISKSLEEGELDSAIELTEKLGHGIKSEKRNIISNVAQQIRTIKKTGKTIVSPKKKLFDESSIDEAITALDSSIEEIFVDDALEAAEQIASEKFSPSGEVIETEGEIVQLGEQQAPPPKEGYNTLGVDLVPPSERTKSQLPSDTDLSDVAPMEVPIRSHIEDIAGPSFIEHLQSSKKEDYNSLGINLIPEVEKNDLSDFLNQVNKEVESFPGAEELKESRKNIGKTEITDDDIQSIIGETKNENIIYIQEDQKVAGSPSKLPELKIDEKAADDPVVQVMMQQAQSPIESQNIQIVQGEDTTSVSTPGQIQFEYAPIPVSSLSEEGSSILDTDNLDPEKAGTSMIQESPIPAGTSDKKKDTSEESLGGILKDALKEALTNLKDESVGNQNFKDENKDLFDSVERPKMTMPELEENEEEDDGKPFFREHKETEFEVHKFQDEGPDESIGRYNNYEDVDEDVETFKDINKQLFDDVDKNQRRLKDDRNGLDIVKKDFEEEDKMHMEQKISADGTKEIIFYNPDKYQKKQKPPKKPPKRVRLSFSFRNLFTNKIYNKYKDILNKAAILVAERRLDEALDYYYTIRDQNIPNVFKMMIQQNIDDIEQTIIQTFQYSDTIVKLKDTGKAIRLRDISEFERQEIDIIRKERMERQEELFFKEEE